LGEGCVRPRQPT